MHTTWDWFGVLDLYWVSNVGWECGFGRSLLGLKFLVGNGDVFGFGLVWLTFTGSQFFGWEWLCLWVSNFGAFSHVVQIPIFTMT